MSPAIAGISAAVPPLVSQRDLWDGFFAGHYAGDRRAQAIWRACGVRTRGAVADPRVEDLRGWTTERRMRRFAEEALPLGKDAVATCLARSETRAEDVDLFAVVSCTGYVTPGLDALLSRDLGMREDVQRLHLGHMGCHAALPALSLASDATSARGARALVLCVELSSLHVQHPQPGEDHVLSHALFGDAAAAALVSPGAGGLEIVEVASTTDASEPGLITWDVTSRGFVMGLSPELPDAIEARVPHLVGGLLRRHGLSVADVAAWAVHPGGPRILEVSARALRLDEEHLAWSREVLRERGNCSSSTILLILERIAAGAGLRPGDHVVALAFGPGLTAAAALLRLGDAA